MSELALTGEELLAWSDTTTRRWCEFVTKNPVLLEVACDIRDAATVGQLLQHIVAVELRYAQRLAGIAETEYSAIRCETGDEILATHDQAVAILRSVMADPNFDWEHELKFQTISAGWLRSKRKTIFVHALMHSIRHFAQLATLARQHGFTPGWAMDYLMMDAKSI